MLKDFNLEIVKVEIKLLRTLIFSGFNPKSQSVKSKFRFEISLPLDDI